jgi:hypothetical protein
MAREPAASKTAREKKTTSRMGSKVDTANSARMRERG